MAEMQMDGSLVRAARHLSQVAVRTVAGRAKVDPKALGDFERGGAALDRDELQRGTAALEHYGIQFIREDINGGVGVRRRIPRSTVTMIERWEGEGGPVGEDDI